MPHNLDEKGVDQNGGLADTASNQEFVKRGWIYDQVALQQSEQVVVQQLIKSNPHYENCNSNSLLRKAIDVVRDVKKLKKNKSKALKAYLEKDFEPPQNKDQICRPGDSQSAKRQLEELQTNTKLLTKENRMLKVQMEQAESEAEKSQLAVEALKEKVADLIDSNEQMISKYSDLLASSKVTQEDLEECENRYSETASSLDAHIKELATLHEREAVVLPRKRALERKDETIKKLRMDLKKSKTLVAQKENEIENLWQEIQVTMVEHENEHDDLVEKAKKAEEDLKAVKIGLQKKASRAKMNLETARRQQDETEKIASEEIAELEKQVKEKEKEVAELQSLVEYMEGDTIKTFESGRYTQELRECCMILLTEGNVSMRKIPKVISTVLEKLTGKLPERLPSQALLSSRILMEARIVAFKQAAEAMLENHQPDKPKGSVLHQDATTFHHDHFEGMQVTLQSGDQYTIGLKQVAGSDAATYMEAFKDSIDELAAAVADTGDEKEQVRAKLVTSIKSLMSDQCASNNVFNNMVQELREKLLPNVIENFETLPADSQAHITEMGTFACRMHLILNMDPAASRALKAYEAAVVEGQNPHSLHHEESGSHRLARTAASAFTKRGSQTAGTPVMWNIFLKGRGRDNKLVTYHGHRMNIGFYNAAAVYYHWKDIEFFLEDWPDRNELMKSIAFDIRESVYKAGCRAAGIIYVLLTEPFENLLKTRGSILELNDDLNTMYEKLTAWSRDGSLPLSRDPVFADYPVKDSELFSGLFEATNDPKLESLTTIALELLAAEILIVLERQASSQLPGGLYWNAPNHIMEMASNVPTTNVRGERDMAVLDNLLRAKPAVSSHNLETLLMWWQNKPSTYLSALSEAEREKVLEDARKRAPEFMKYVAAKKEKLQKELEEKLRQKNEKQEVKEAKSMNEKVRWTRSIVEYGGPWDATEVKTKVDDLPPTEQRTALLTQIKFHKFVLGAKGPRILFQESSQKQKFSVERLTENLLDILAINGVNVREPEVPHLEYKQEEQYIEEIDLRRTELFEKLKKTKQQSKIKQVKLKLKDFLREPEKLVGKRVHHKCLEDGEIDWFTGKVTAITRHQENKMKTEYAIVYDTCPDDTWNFPLLMDIKNSDLFLA